MNSAERQFIEDCAHAAVKRAIASGKAHRVTAAEAAIIAPLLRGNRTTSGQEKDGQPSGPRRREHF